MDILLLHVVLCIRDTLMVLILGLFVYFETINVSGRTATFAVIF